MYDFFLNPFIFLWKQLKEGVCCFCWIPKSVFVRVEEEVLSEGSIEIKNKNKLLLVSKSLCGPHSKVLEPQICSLPLISSI